MSILLWIYIFVTQTNYILWAVALLVAGLGAFLLHAAPGASGRLRRGFGNPQIEANLRVCPGQEKSQTVDIFREGG